VLNEGSSVESSTFGHAATKFLVVKGVEHMYDVLISTHCAKEWGSRPDPVTSLLEYRPFLTWGDLKTMASIPLYTTAAQSWSEVHAAGVFVCGVAAVNPAKVIAALKLERAPVLSAASDAYFTHSAHLIEPGDKSSASTKETTENTAQRSVDVKFANAETKQAHASMTATGQPFRSDQAASGDSLGARRVQQALWIISRSTCSRVHNLRRSSVP
jgi:hypothetical protein